MKTQLKRHLFLLIFTFITSQFGYSQNQTAAPFVTNHYTKSKTTNQVTIPKSLGISTNSIAKCIADEATSSFIQQQLAINPNYQSKINQQETAITNWAQNYLQNKNGMAVRTIPVVVHVVHNPNNSNSPDENVPDSYIFDMLTTLNEDFRRQNSDASQTRALFASVAADSEIEFCLASKDPNGLTTTGITRTSSSEGSFNPDTETNKMKSDGTNGKTGWPSDDYLNIWICNISNYANSGTAGYAYLPTPGMHGSSIDGLVIDFKLGIYYGGRTATHEIGHYLGLQHTWGSNPPSCNNDDGFADTPNSSSENYGCNYSTNTCSGGDIDQIENYMSYANCQNMYSSDQAAYMNSVLTNTRSSLLSSTGCEPTSSPSADFTSNKTTVQAGGYVSFSDLTTGVPTTWSWNFGGGGTPNTSTDRDPVIQFTTIGTYTVTLTVTNTLGSDSETKTTYITVTAPSGCDTLNYPPPGTLALYTSGTGYVCGWNQYGDLSKAEIFTAANYSPNTHITGGLFYFYNAYDASGGTSTVDFNVWDAVGGLPNTIIGTKSMLLSEIQYDTDNGYLTQVLFDSPIPVTGDVFFGITMNLNANDTLAVISNTIGDSNPGTAYEEWSDNTWHDMTTAWGGFDVSMFMSPYFTDQPPTASFTASPTSGCYGLTVNFDASASTDVFDYYWDFDGDGFYDDVDTVDGLISHTYDTAGTFDVTLLVVGACTGLGKDIQTSLVTINPKPSLTTTATNASCGSCNGAATVSASGASAPYTYLWNDPANSATSSIGSLCDASYQVTVTDANGCIEVTGVNVLDGASMSLSTTATNATCGNTNGTATATSTGGSTPYTYAWDDPGTQATQTAVGLDAGTYHVTITDASGCTIQTDFFSAAVVSSTGAISSSISSSTSPTCNGTSTGAATAIASGGTAPFTYSWNSTPSQNTATAAGLPAGTFIATITDAAGCTSTSSVTLTEPSAIIINTTSTSATCGNSDGSASVSVTSGGTSPFTYSWSNGASGATASSLAAGGYTATVTDANGCTSTASATVSDAGGPSATSSSTNTTCNGGSDGTAIVIATGGTAPYTYAWSNGDITANISGLIAGTYTVNITDATGCVASSSVTITEPNAIVSNVTNTNENCGNSDGTATVTVTGGTAPLTYTWSNGQTTSTATGLAAGTFQYTITDANGCTTSGTATVGSTNGPSASATSTDANCGNSDGTATVTVTGGNAPLNFSWSNGQSTSTATGLAAGTYQYTITDANGCITSGAVTVGSSNGPTATTTSIDASCGNSDGTATVAASGGTAPYTYSWSDGQSTATATGLAAGTYTIVVTDANGCTVTETATVVDSSAPTSTSTSTDASCFGNSDGTATVTVSGGTSPYGYYWDDQNNSTTSTVSNLSAGTFNVTVTDASGCQTTSSVTIGEPSVLAVTSTTTTTVQGGPCTGTITATPSGGTPSYAYSWSDGQTTSTATGLCVGSYTVTITDANGCTTTGTQLVSEVTGIENNTFSILSIYPNPTNGTIQYDLPNLIDGFGKIEIFNSSGKLIEKINLDNQRNLKGSIDLSTNPNGIYFLHTTLKNNKYVNRVTLIK